MLRSKNEVAALRELYVELGVARAIEEVNELFNLTDAQLEADRAMEAQLKTEAHSFYRRARGLLATDEEFENLVWPNMKEDLKREVKALEAML